MKEKEESSQSIIWKFLRGDMLPAEFESWVYSSPELEDSFGEKLYLDLISTNFSEDRAVLAIKEQLRSVALSQRESGCLCVTLPNLASVGMTAEMPEMESLEVRNRKGREQWWLAEYCCSECGEAWLVAEESRQNDVFLMKRLSESERRRIEEENIWPSDFNSFEHLLRLGPRMGHRYRFFDPFDSSLSCTAADLAEERPGISIQDLQELLNLDFDTARSIAQKAKRERSVVIDIEP